jgi:hypothetical protein
MTIRRVSLLLCIAVIFSACGWNSRNEVNENVFVVSFNNGLRPELSDISPAPIPGKNKLNITRNDQLQVRNGQWQELEKTAAKKPYDYYQADEFPFFLIIDIEKKELAGVYIEHGNNMHVILFNNSEPLHDGSIYQIHFAVYTPQFVFKVLGDKVYYARIRD